MTTTETAARSPVNALRRSARQRRYSPPTLLLLAIVWAPPVTKAQEPGSLQELMHAGELRKGDGVYVTDAGGRRLKGTLTDLSSSLLTLTRGDTAWSVPAARVRRIQRQDSLLNVVLIGAGVGAALTCMAHPGCGSAPVAVTAHVVADHGAVHLLLLGA